MVVARPERFLGFVRMEADLKYSPDDLEQLYVQKPQWEAFQDYGTAVRFLSDAARVIDTSYPPRMLTELDPVDRNYLVYEFARPGVAEAVSNYFLYENWDLETAVVKVADNAFDFPVLQLQEDSDPSQPAENFADVEQQFPNGTLEWVTNASHFTNFDQPEQVADALNRFLRAAKQ